MEELLSYEFENVTNNSAVVTLRWEKLAVPVKVDVATKDLVIAHARDGYLRGLAGFTWQGFFQAAGYCLQNNMNLDEALTWINKSVALNENSNNLYVKGGLLDKLGKSEEADTVRKRMMSIAKTEVDLNLLGYLYLNAGKKREAIDVFKKNVRTYPDSWNVYDSLGEGYAANGDTKLAIDNYSKALSMV
jgi:tetratricopeptide (TPR) repeat protein